MNRRERIKTFAALAPLTIARRVWAAPATDARLLVVLLRGAYDGASSCPSRATSIMPRGRAGHRQTRRRQPQRGAAARCTVYWVLGGSINGGRILGEQVKVDQPHLFQNRDYPVLADYRALFADLIRSRLLPQQRKSPARLRRRSSDKCGAGLS